MKGNFKEAVILFVFIVLLVMFMSFQDDTNSEEIIEKVHSIDGEVIDIQSKSILSNTPFLWNTKEMRIYKFTYTIGGEENIGWYRSTMFGRDWILDYKED